MNPTRVGIDALLEVAPVWSTLVSASAVVSLDGRWLLHAGPPLADPCNPPAPILSSAVLACIYEGWADSPETAERAIHAGGIKLESAQRHRCVTPLAALVSPGTSMVAVHDHASLVPAVYAPLGTIGGPDTRFGTRDAGILERLKLRDTQWTQLLRVALTEPFELLPIAAAAIAHGDDLHNRTTAATQALAERMAARFSELRHPETDLVAQFMSGLAATPLFFLTLWMAAAKLILSAAEHGEPRTIVTSMGGNGETFGIALAGRPDAWCSMPATAPQGPYLDPSLSANVPLGAIGDSAVIDALGFGGQALCFAPEPRAALAPYLPRGSIPSGLLAVTHPAFADLGVRVALDAARVATSEMLPVITLAMVEKTGERGLLGRGVMVPPRELYVNAVREVS